MDNELGDLIRLYQDLIIERSLLASRQAALSEIANNNAELKSILNRLISVLMPLMCTRDRHILKNANMLFNRKTVHAAMEYTDRDDVVHGTTISHSAEEFLENVRVKFLYSVANGSYPALMTNASREEVLQTVQIQICLMATNMRIEQWRKQGVRDNEVTIKDGLDGLHAVEVRNPETGVHLTQFSEALLACRKLLPVNELRLKDSLDIFKSLWESWGNAAPAMNPTIIESFRHSTGRTPAQKLGQVLGISQASVTLRKNKLIELMVECLRQKGFEVDAENFCLT